LIQVISFIWNQVLIGPATNFIVVLDRLLFGSYGLAIIVFTILLRLATLPLTLRQMQSSRRMQTLQPKIQEIQKKYSDPKRRSEETMKLYKQEGVNPAGCLLPTLIQFPIWIALYQVIRITLGSTPESMIDLSHRLYPWSFVQQAVPLASHFIWLNLGSPDTSYILPVLVFITMFVQQKLTMTPASMAANTQTAQTNQMMLWFMPILFAWFSISVPSGLAMYWVITNVAGIALNYYVFEWRGTPWVDILGLRNFKLSSMNPATLLLPQPKAARPGGRSAPARDSRGPRPAADVDSSVAAQNGKPRPAGGQNARRGSAARQGRKRSVAPPPKSQPKAPPVSRPAQPPATGRLGTDPAGSNGGSETRSTDGRGS